MDSIHYNLHLKNCKQLMLLWLLRLAYEAYEDKQNSFAGGA